MYKASLGRPWLHENRVVPLTLHQCMKYVKDGRQRRINRDIKPFGVREVGLSDTPYFLTQEKKNQHKMLIISVSSTLKEKGVKTPTGQIKPTPSLMSSQNKKAPPLGNKPIYGMSSDEEEDKKVRVYGTTPLFGASFDEETEKTSTHRIISIYEASIDKESEKERSVGQKD